MSHSYDDASSVHDEHAVPIDENTEDKTPLDSSVKNRDADLIGDDKFWEHQVEVLEQHETDPEHHSWGKIERDDTDDNVADKTANNTADSAVSNTVDKDDDSIVDNGPIYTDRPGYGYTVPSMRDASMRDGTPAALAHGPGYGYTVPSDILDKPVVFVRPLDEDIVNPIRKALDDKHANDHTNRGVTIVGGSAVDNDGELARYYRVAIRSALNEDDPIIREHLLESLRLSALDGPLAGVYEDETGSIIADNDNDDDHANDHTDDNTGAITSSLPTTALAIQVIQAIADREKTTEGAELVFRKYGWNPITGYPITPIHTDNGYPRNGYLFFALRDAIEWLSTHTSDLIIGNRYAEDDEDTIGYVCMEHLIDVINIYLDYERELPDDDYHPVNIRTNEYIVNSVRPEDIILLVSRRALENAIIASGADHNTDQVREPKRSYESSLEHYALKSISSGILQDLDSLLVGSLDYYTRSVLPEVRPTVYRDGSVYYASNTHDDADDTGEDTAPNKDSNDDNNVDNTVSNNVDNTVQGAVNGTISNGNAYDGVTAASSDEIRSAMRFIMDLSSGIELALPNIPIDSIKDVDIEGIVDKLREAVAVIGLNAPVITSSRDPFGAVSVRAAVDNVFRITDDIIEGWTVDNEHDGGRAPHHGSDSRILLSLVASNFILEIDGEVQGGVNQYVVSEDEELSI